MSDDPTASERLTDKQVALATVACGYYSPFGSAMGGALVGTAIGSMLFAPSAMAAPAGDAVDGQGSGWGSSGGSDFGGGGSDFGGGGSDFGGGDFGGGDF